MVLIVEGGGGYIIFSLNLIHPRLPFCTDFSRTEPGRDGRSTGIRLSPRFPPVCPPSWPSRVDIDRVAFRASFLAGPAWHSSSRGGWKNSWKKGFRGGPGGSRAGRAARRTFPHSRTFFPRREKKNQMDFARNVGGSSPGVVTFTNFTSNFYIKKKL